MRSPAAISCAAIGENGNAYRPRDEIVGAIREIRGRRECWRGGKIFQTSEWSDRILTTVRNRVPLPSGTRTLNLFDAQNRLVATPLVFFKTPGIPV